MKHGSPVSFFQYTFVPLILNRGPHDKNFLALINNENFLRGATEQNTRSRQLVMFARASEALRAV